MRLGVHVSIAGGVDEAFERGREVGCDCIQIFTKSSNQWKAKPLADETVTHYFLRQAETGITPVVAHASYLPNMASPDDTLWHKSLNALAVELERCHTLTIPYLVIHPGSHVGSGEEAGIARIASALDWLHDKLPDIGTKIALETTAGQGTNLGYRFEQLAQMIEATAQPDRLVVCFDTCHALAAGYDFRSRAGYADVLRQFDEILGLDRLKVFHLNDSKFDLGSRRDRHEHIGMGYVGLEGFGNIVRDDRFSALPGLLETPKSKDRHEDVENLSKLRSLAK